MIPIGRTRSIVSFTPLLAISALMLGACRGAPAEAPKPVVREAAPATDLAFNELLRAGGDSLQPSAKTLSLAGKRVRLKGFMAQMELPPKGGFFLVPRPVHCDEAGGGTADLPLDSVLVISRSVEGRAIEWIQGALEMTGILEVGNHADDDGRVSAFRLRLDGPMETQVAMTQRSTGGAPSAPSGDRRTDAP